MRYLRDGFFYGREFVSDEDLNDQALHWLETVANARVHGTLKEVPLDRFERERFLLGPLAERPYAGVLSVPSAAAEEVLSPPRVVEGRSLGLARVRMSSQGEMRVRFQNSAYRIACGP